MKKYLWVALTILGAVGYQQNAKAQYTLDGRGGIIRSTNMTGDDVDGSAFLFTDWSPGKATTASGKVINELRLKYDIIDDIPVFASDKDAPLSFSEKIKIFTLNYITFASGFPAVDTLGTRNFYQVLTDGKAMLLKHYTRHAEKNKPYGASTVSLTYNNYEMWYIFKDGKMTRVRPSAKSIIDGLGDKKDQMMAFIKDKKDLKTDAQLALIVTYYNSL